MIYLTVPILASCAATITPGQLETEFRAEVRPAASVREVEAFLEEREIGYARWALERKGILYAAIRDVKPSLWRTYDVLLEFHFDSSGHLMKHTIGWGGQTP